MGRATKYMWENQWAAYTPGAASEHDWGKFSLNRWHLQKADGIPPTSIQQAFGPAVLSEGFSIPSGSPLPHPAPTTRGFANHFRAVITSHAKGRSKVAKDSVPKILQYITLELVGIWMASRLEETAQQLKTKLSSRIYLLKTHKFLIFSSSDPSMLYIHNCVYCVPGKG